LSSRSDFCGQERAHFVGSGALRGQDQVGKKMGKIDEKVWHGVLLEMLA
jgi:hypothetical protein